MGSPSECFCNKPKEIIALAPISEPDPLFEVIFTEIDKVPSSKFREFLQQFLERYEIPND